MNPFTVIAYNCNSIVNFDRVVALRKFIDCYKPDVLMISETKLKEGLRIPLINSNYNSFFQSNLTQRGGTAMLVHKSHLVRHFTRGNGPIEYTSVQIRVSDCWIKFFSCYLD